MRQVKQKNPGVGSSRRDFNPQSMVPNPQSGYTLVGLLAVMTLLVLFAAAAAPSVKQQSQREREKEAIFRGEEVANAIRLYVEYQSNVRHVNGVAALPTSMDQLLEGLPRGTQKIQILRPEAAVDPLSQTGEWRLIGPTTQSFVQFAQAVIEYAGGTPPITHGAVLRTFVPQFGTILNTGSTDTTSGGEDTSDNTSGPFLGVASRSRRNSVITYYGIDRHDQWIFTPIFR